MRKKIIAGNWKMHLNHLEAVELVEGLQEQLKKVNSEYEVSVFPPFTSIYPVSCILDKRLVKLGAQNAFYEKQGAYTGEVSTLMLKAIGCDYVIIGHSERRKYFHEDDSVIARKVRSSIDAGITPVLCVGETLEEREAGKEKEVVRRQLLEGLKLLSKEEARGVVVAYEPVWAIGTGRNASPEQAQEMHGYIRELLGCEFAAEEVSVLYGGSVKPENIFELTRMKDVDGALVGGASIKVDSFMGIIKNAYQGGD